MSTRSCVARLVTRENNQLGFEGKYIHWDGYPSGVGSIVWQEAKRLGVEKILEHIIDFKCNGWSSLSIPLDGEFVNMEDSQGRVLGSKYYPALDDDEYIACETDKNGMEWCYAFEQKDGKWYLHVLSSINQDGSKMIGAFGKSSLGFTWKEVACIDMSLEEEPDWDEIE